MLIMILLRVMIRDMSRYINLISSKHYVNGELTSKEEYDAKREEFMDGGEYKTFEYDDGETLIVFK